ncbi:MAG: ABC transporter ATP-binding protein [Fimbriimonadaceae bacterium]|nr:ABC transporter ATP-binding protein [Fimbriimonadaceae bacterium]QYK58903.1 MAG: ABC transporter ATP-binding protein [Fimbriimonadaceae bacterium]
MLKIDSVDVFYGAIQALNGVTIHVDQGEIVSIIGSNGAGKSTLLRTISGLLRPRRGSIRFLDREIDGASPDQIVRLGVSQSPEGRRIFTNMSVHENLQLGAFTRSDGGVAADMERVMDKFPRVRERLRQNAGTMSGGEQQMLAMCRALMSRPKLLLLDEPSMGLAPNLVTEIFNIIGELNRDGVTVLLVEQNAHRALEIANRGYVLETGQVVLEGSGPELLHDPKVKEAYLGG